MPVFMGIRTVGIQLLYNPEDGVALEVLERTVLFVNNDCNLDGAERWEDGGPRVLGARGGQRNSSTSTRSIAPETKMSSTARR